MAEEYKIKIITVAPHKLLDGFWSVHCAMNGKHIWFPYRKDNDEQFVEGEEYDVLYDSTTGLCVPKGYSVDNNEGKSSALSEQVGGSHYKGMVIQPVEFIHKNGIGFCEGAAIKYLCRWKQKNGVEDLKKAKHFIEMLIEMEEKK